MKLNLKVVVALAFSSSILTLAAPMPQGGDWAIVKGLKSAKKLLRGQSYSGRARYAAEQAHAEDLTASHHASSPGRAGGPEYDRQMVLYQGATEHERSYRPSPEHYGSSNQHHESSPARSSVHSEDEWTPLSPPRRQQSVPGGAMVPYVEQPREQPQPFYGMQYVSTSPPRYAAPSSHGAPEYVHPNYHNYGYEYQRAQYPAPTYGPDPSSAWGDHGGYQSGQTWSGHHEQGGYWGGRKYRKASSALTRSE